MMEQVKEKVSAINMDQVWQDQVERMKLVIKFTPPAPRPTFKIKGAKEWLVSCYTYMLSLQGKEFVYTPQLDKIAEWLTDTKGKGLVLYGQCGMGKTFLAKYVLPVLLSKVSGLPALTSFYDATYAIAHTDEILKITSDVIIIDDVGQEGEYVDYGTRRHTMDEIMDFMEKENKILIITSNLKDEDDFRNRYGDRFTDRMLGYMFPVLFYDSSKKSFRRPGSEVHKPQKIDYTNTPF